MTEEEGEGGEYGNQSLATQENELRSCARERSEGGWIAMSVELPRHELDEDGDHDPSECQKCLEREHTVICSCDCGDCCRNLLIETTLADAVREPLIAQRGKPYRDLDDVVGYLLNDDRNGNACTFFDQATNRCTIWETRPGVCRLFDCDDPQNRAHFDT